jgi:O-antigen ligase
MLYLPSLSSGGQFTGARAKLMFDNPNMAGNYFLLSFFILLLSAKPRNRFVRASGLLIILGAIVATGSNGSLIALVLGVVAAGLFALWRRTSLEVVIIATAIGCALLIALVFFVNASGIVRRVENSTNPILKISIARGPKSAEGRKTLYSSELDLYRTGSLAGIGPATTKVTLEKAAGPIVKEAHDDYLATLIERGPIGALGLLLLMGAIGVRAFSVARRAPPRLFGPVLRNPSALVGVVVAMAAEAVTHEILHYRHVWAVLGIIAGLYLLDQRKPSPTLADASVALNRAGS